MDTKLNVLFLTCVLAFNACNAQQNDSTSSLPCIEMKNINYNCFTSSFLSGCSCTIENIFNESKFDTMVDYDKLDKLYNYLIKNYQLNVKIEAYFYDSNGVYRIGNKKAERVKKYLVGKGIEDSRLKVWGLDILKQEKDSSEIRELRLLRIVIR